MLREALSLEGRIDFLKIDTEGLENATVSAIDRELLGAIGTICFETRVPVNPWPERFAMSFATETCRLEAATAPPVDRRPGGISTAGDAR